MSNIVVLHSGGQDSTTSLAWAIDQWGRDRIHPVCFDYDQRHAVELEQAKKIAQVLNVRRPVTLDVSVLTGLSATALTDPSVMVEGAATEDGGNVYAARHDLPSTFVPGRNMLFFTLAAAYGALVDADTLVTGVCATDRAGYPDCRVEFVEQAEKALTLALDQATHIIAPLLRRTKAETFKLAQDLDVLELVIDLTHTCYHGDRSQKWAWGYGCAECPACRERAKGFEEFKHAEFVGRLP